MTSYRSAGTIFQSKHGFHIK